MNLSKYFLPIAFNARIKRSILSRDLSVVQFAFPMLIHVLKSFHTNLSALTLLFTGVTRKKIKQMTREYYLDKYSKQIEIIATIIIPFVGLIVGIIGIFSGASGKQSATLIIFSLVMGMIYSSIFLGGY